MYTSKDVRTKNVMRGKVGNKRFRAFKNIYASKI